MQLPRVLLQIEIPTETFRTDAAGERLALVVGVHVEGQVIDLMERLVADATLIRFLPAVRQPVVLVVPLLMEPFSTEFADEGLVASVDARVRVQGR